MAEEREIVGWITVNGAKVPLFKGESKEDAINRHIAKENETKKANDIAKNKEQADKLNEKDKKSEYEMLGNPDKDGNYKARNSNGEVGRVINGKFYSNKYLDNLMKTPEGRNEFNKIMGKEPVKSSPNDEKKQEVRYSFSQDKKLSDVEKDWLEQAVDWANGKDNLPMTGMNTIANYYGVKFGKSASIIRGINHKGDIEFGSMNKTLMNQAFGAIEKLKAAIREKESKK